MENEGYKYERIDGGITGNLRQDAIDRFNGKKTLKEFASINFRKFTTIILLCLQHQDRPRLLSSYQHEREVWESIWPQLTLSSSTIQTGTLTTTSRYNIVEHA